MNRVRFSTVDAAQRWAARIGIRAGFDSREFDNEGRCWTGSFGSADPCGCAHFDTVLVDGSLGWGEWSEFCGVTECAYD